MQKLVGFLIFASAVLFAALIGCDPVELRQKSKGSIAKFFQDEAFQEPITVAASNFGDFSEGYPWYLSINANGDLFLLVNHLDGDRSTVSKLGRYQMAELRRTLESTDFFSTEETVFGREILGGSRRTLTVTVGQDTKTVTLLSLHDIGEADADSRSNLQGVIQVQTLLRSWVSDDGAVDFRRQNDKVLRDLQAADAKGK